ncbi:hypothetical protein HHI36_016508 [Cryptolaemus montrouzieri]|uniref:Mutator-like transposase domain-containing protein n=1 Tax=Cryptolaemus montrouzieri TaxID=559131 RepID=A0ABD2NJW9_9CUCU
MVVCVCPECGIETLQLRLVNVVDVLSKVLIRCIHCGYVFKFTNSPKVSMPSRTGRSKEVYDVNLLLVYGMRSKGKAMSAAKEFSAVMNMPRPPKFNKYEAILNVASEKMCQERMDTSKEEAVAQNSGDRDIVAAFDGSWQKRGHTGCFNEN